MCPYLLIWTALSICVTLWICVHVIHEMTTIFVFEKDGAAWQRNSAVNNFSFQSRIDNKINDGRNELYMCYWVI